MNNRLLDLNRMLEESLREAGVPFRRVSFLEMNRSTTAELAVAMLAFLDDSPAPFAFVKATPNPTRAAQLATEFQNLTYLRERGSDAFLRSVPEPIHLGRFEDLTVLIESALPGSRMKDFPPDRYAASPDFERHFEAAVGWLGEFQATVSPGEDDAPPLRLGAAASVERYTACYTASAAVRDLLQEAADALWDYDGAVVPWHGDFCTANLIVTEGGGDIAVIDWEYPLVRSWPLADLLYFVASTWCTPYAKGRRALAANYREMFFAPHAYSELLKRATSSYVERLGVDGALLLPLAAICWVAYANRKRDELEERSAGGVPEDGSSFMPLIMVEDGRCLNLEILAELRERFLPR